MNHTGVGKQICDAFYPVRCSELVMNALKRRGMFPCRFDVVLRDSRPDRGRIRRTDLPKGGLDQTDPVKRASCVTEAPRAFRGHGAILELDR